MNQTQIWKNPHLPDVEFFSAHYTDFIYAPHFHEDYALGVVEHGVHAFHYRGEKHAVPVNHVVTCQPGEIHNGHPGSEDVWRYRMMYVRPELMQQVAEELGYRTSALPFLSYTAIGHQQAVQMVRAVHRRAEAHEPTLSQEELLREMLALILGHFSEIRLHPSDIRDENTSIASARAYIHEHWAQDIQLDQLASVAYLSKSYFIRAFRHRMGMSPYAYLIQVRLNRAKALLRNGAAPIDVAQQTGFYDQSHFTHYFKRFMGVPPGQYQQAAG